MKPIIVVVENGNIKMTIDEFKKHIDDAYYKGYHDASSITSSSQSNKWWNDLRCDELSATLNTASKVTASDHT